jgi:hypothetical protein
MNWWRQLFSNLMVKKEYFAIGPMRIPWHGVFIWLIMLATVASATVYTAFDFGTNVNSSGAAGAVKKFTLTAECVDNPLVFSTQGDLEVHLAWTTLTGVQTYSIRRLAPTGTWLWIAYDIPPTDNPSFVDTTVLPDTQYIYQVRAEGQTRTRLTNTAPISTTPDNCN